MRRGAGACAWARAARGAQVRAACTAKLADTPVGVGPRCTAELAQGNPSDETTLTLCFALPPMLRGPVTLDWYSKECHGHPWGQSGEMYVCGSAAEQVIKLNRTPYIP